MLWTPQTKAKKTKQNKNQLYQNWKASWGTSMPSISTRIWINKTFFVTQADIVVGSTVSELGQSWTRVQISALWANSQYRANSRTLGIFSNVLHLFPHLLCSDTSSSFFTEDQEMNISDIPRTIFKTYHFITVAYLGTSTIFTAGLPRWFSGKESACQFRRCQFNPWVGKRSQRRK